MGAQFAAWLKQQRIDRGISQAELSDAVSCASDTLRKLEAGTRQPSRQLAELFATYFGVPEDEHEAFVGFARLKGAPADTDGSLRNSTAPWRTLRTRLTNMTVSSTSLIGRDADLAALRALLARRQSLITITGPPGVGKTRLAQALGSDPQLAEEFPDGVFFVPLAPLTDHERVPGTIATALRLQESSNSTWEETLRHYLAGRRMLLLLDNFEHVMAAAPSLAELASAASWVKIVVTSREELAVRGERVYRLSPLALPDAQLYANAVTPAIMLDYAAVALYAERAVDADPDFALTPQNAAVVARLCARLDGLPLAIELVTARSALFSPAELLTQLAVGQADSGYWRDLPVRQRTLAAAIGWSYELLDPDEKAIFRLMSVFAGGTEVDAVVALADSDVSPSTIGTSSATGTRTQTETLHAANSHSITLLLGALAAKSLLVRKTEKGVARFTMLETIRAYSWEQLVEQAKSHRVRDAHARYFTELAQQAYRGFFTEQQRDWFERLRKEEDNLRAALEWLVSSGSAEQAIRLAGLLGRYWYMSSNFSEGRYWMARVLEHPGNREVKAADIARVHYWYGTYIPFGGGDLDGARAEYARGLALIQTAEDAESREVHAQLLSALGNASRLSGDLVAAEDSLNKSARLFTELGDRVRYAMSIFNLSHVASSKGDYAQQALLLSEAGSIWREAGNLHDLVYVLEGQATLALNSGDTMLAKQLTDEFQPLYEQWDDKRGIVVSYYHRGGVALLQGDWPEAEHFYRQCIRLAQPIGDNWSILHCLFSLAKVAAAQDLPERSALLFGAVEALRPLLGQLQVVSDAMRNELIELLSTQLGDEVLSRYRQEGAAMSMEQATVYALGETA